MEVCKGVTEPPKRNLPRWPIRSNAFWHIQQPELPSPAGKFDPREKPANPSPSPEERSGFEISLAVCFGVNQNPWQGRDPGP
ncbi:hypothetical protein PAAG_04108 [Paracoccidioides lutzii Pb01]|uniref:Uncharacterized protein n=1 Tax=Paracoccidioides lutzii (strain ATCC MYA-826 / Pb01) TaxID=502779 RepID=C1H014_PARBA|nr:hypothetical protein PAAG_04108 [Paracoccidioides lutzii Pb01]EEH33055.2 hypothetical protein PAAG_04108 [Paracoccidioides lutzii Pb01]